MVSRVILLVLDGVGVGELPDAAAYGDGGANTLAHVAEATGGLHVPNLEALGLGYLGPFAGVRRIGHPDGCFGKMATRSKGKDSATGHWELAGVIAERRLPACPDGIPAEVLGLFQQAIGRSVLGNRALSAATALQEMGEEHLRTGMPIVCTGTDSVVQIAAHERVVPVEDLYRICLTARKLLTPPHQVARVIARPFAGEPGAFAWMERRRDFSIEPPGQTLLDALKMNGHPVVGIGKIDDLFQGRGITRTVRTGNNAASLDATLQAIASVPRGLIFVNLGGFDRLDGQQKGTEEFVRALSLVDTRLSDIFRGMQPDDLLCITADHGHDPTRPVGGHTREHVPLLVYGSRLARGVNLGTRKTLADLGQTIAEALGVKRLAWGESFLHALAQG